ncbi:MAG: hypothetical protein ABW042_11625 [Phenylobacterium sp.]
MLAALPLLALPVLIYNVLALTVAAPQMTEILFTVRMASGADWPVRMGDMLLTLSLVVLFVELLKSTSSHRAAILNHGLSMLLFVVCLVELLLGPAFASARASANVRFRGGGFRGGHGGGFKGGHGGKR